MIAIIFSKFSLNNFNIKENFNNFLQFYRSEKYFISDKTFLYFLYIFKNILNCYFLNFLKDFLIYIIFLNFPDLVKIIKLTLCFKDQTVFNFIHIIIQNMFKFD